MQLLHKFELAINDRPTSFRIVEDGQQFILALKISTANNQVLPYQRLNAWLKNEYDIQGQIDEKNDAGSNLNLSFSTPDTLIIMAILLLLNRILDTRDHQKFLDLAKLALKVSPFIINNKKKKYIAELYRILRLRYDKELAQFIYLNDSAASLKMELIPLNLGHDGDSKNYQLRCPILLSNIIHLLSASSRLYRNVITCATIRTTDCNMLAYRAVTAVEILKRIEQQHPEALQFVIHACFKRNNIILLNMKLATKSVITNYLNFFDFPTKPLTSEELHAIKFNYNSNYPFRQQKNDLDEFEYRSKDIVDINKTNTQKLTLRVSQLISLRNQAEIILNNYQILSGYLKEINCVLSGLLPDSEELLHPLFHKYNSYISPLTSAIYDKKLNQAMNLQLFRELAKAKRYNQSTMNIAINIENPEWGYQLKSPLAHAIENAIPEVVKILLENEAPFFISESPLSSLDCAMKRGNLAIIKLLIEFGADVHNRTILENSSPLHYACDVDCTRWLIEHIIAMSIEDPSIKIDESLNTRDALGNTPLHIVAKRQVTQNRPHFSNYEHSEQPEVESQKLLMLMQMFIDNKIDIDAVNENGYTALHCALNFKLENRQHKAHIPTALLKVKMLCKAGANVNIISNGGGERSYRSALKHPFPSMTPLLTLNDNEFKLQNPDRLNENDKLYIHQIARVLIEHGAILNCLDSKFLSPLYKSALAGCPVTVKLLLDNGANPNFRMNKYTPTALYSCMEKICIEYTYNNYLIANEIACLELLLNAEASPKICILKEIRLEPCTANIPTMKLVFNQDNDFSRYAAKTAIVDKNESILEKFIRVLTSLDLQYLDVTVTMNAVQYCKFIYVKAFTHHPCILTTFNHWLDFYISVDVRSLVTVLCLSSLWIHIPKDLLNIFSANLVDNPLQIKRLTQWIMDGRKSLKSQMVLAESKQVRTALPNMSLRFFEQNAGLQWRLYDGFLTENRHNDHNIQHAYDQRFGLIKSSRCITK
jgi:ankyrin repeat protein